MLYGSRPSDFREEIGRIMRSKNSGIRDDFSLRFMTLESGEAAVVNDAWERSAQRQLPPRNHRPPSFWTSVWPGPPDTDLARHSRSPAEGLHPTLRQPNSIARLFPSPRGWRAVPSNPRSVPARLCCHDLVRNGRTKKPRGRGRAPLRRAAWTAYDAPGVGRAAEGPALSWLGGLRGSGGAQAPGSRERTRGRSVESRLG